EATPNASGKTTPMRMMPDAAHRIPSLKFTNGPASPLAWMNRPGPGMPLHVRTTAAPALSTARPVADRCAPAGKTLLAHPLPAAPGFGTKVPPAALHGQAAA